MKSESLQTILAEIAAEAVPAVEIDLWPALQRDLVANAVRLQKGGATMTGTRLQRHTWRYAILAALAVIILALVIFLLTPRGRAWAQELFGFFNTTDRTWFQLEPTPTPLSATFALSTHVVTPASTPAADAPQCGTAVSPIASTFPCQLQNAEAQLGYQVKSFAAGDSPLVFQMMRVKQDAGTVTIIFDDPATGEVYSLTQGAGDFPTTSRPVPESAVEQVHVGDYPAAYVSGGFIPGGDGRAAYWEPTFPLRELRWQVDGRWLAISASLGTLAEDQLKERLIDLAAHLVTLSQGSDRLAGAADPPLAERVGFALKEPALLPDGFFFCGAAYGQRLAPDPNTVIMRYCYEEDGRQVGTMAFYQTPDTNSFDFFQFFVSSPAELILDEAVSIGGIRGQYVVESDGHAALVWAQDGNKLMLELRWSPTYGGRLEKEVLLTVAESLQ